MSLHIVDLYLEPSEWDEIENILKCFKNAKITTLALQRADLNFVDMYEIWLKLELETKKIGELTLMVRD